MTTCENHGDSVLVYDEYDCPACEALEEQAKDYEGKIADLEGEVAEANDRIVELESELEEAKNG